MTNNSHSYNGYHVFQFFFAGAFQNLSQPDREAVIGPWREMRTDDNNNNNGNKADDLYLPSFEDPQLNKLALVRATGEHMTSKLKMHRTMKPTT